GTGGTGGSGGSMDGGGGIQCGPGGFCPGTRLLCCPCTGLCYPAGCLSCCMFCRIDGGTNLDCTPSPNCQGGPACGNTCCRRGEWCDTTNRGGPICRCGDNPACAPQQTCCGVGPPRLNQCGSTCVNGICPVLP